MLRMTSSADFPTSSEPKQLPGAGSGGMVMGGLESNLGGSGGGSSAGGAETIMSPLDILMAAQRKQSKGVAAVAVNAELYM